MEQERQHQHSRGNPGGGSARRPRNPRGGPYQNQGRGGRGRGGDYRQDEGSRGSWRGEENAAASGRGYGGGGWRGRGGRGYQGGYRQERDQFEHGDYGGGRRGGRARGNTNNYQHRRQENRSNLNPNAPTFHPNSEEVDDRPTYNLPGDNVEMGAANYRESSEDRREDIENDNRLVPPSRDKDKPRNQREVLTDNLSRNSHECMVCCEKVRHSHPIWSCKRCFNVFHLACIRKWVAKSDDETGWRCPSCQSCHENSPDGYYCFCEKTKNPKSSRYDVPHTCGQVCGKPNPGGANCTHSCNIQCHPGPCPTCEVQQVRFCGCGKTKAQVKCGSKTVIACDSVCDKKLNCGVHHCKRVCHQSDCDPCEAEIQHECHCGKERKLVKCTFESSHCKFYSCAQPCNKPLSCGSHNCDDLCHPGKCGCCKTSPDAIMSCPCGQTGIAEACKLAGLMPRKKCTDPIPTCGKKCLKVLTCGDPPHQCQKKCHLSKQCPPCNLTSTRKCRCGSKTIEMKCKELKSSSEITCGKKCNKKRSCGKHKCTFTCCIDLDHICPVVCQRPLRCGLHKCERLCHLNPCPPCGNVSFDELSCECGTSIIYPPVPCGTKRPPCQLPCSREHACDHPVHHPCHSEPSCPPCTVLTEKWCHGLHELRKNVMCHITSLSCGLPCKKPLRCGRHKCPKVCHSGVCLEEGETCSLPCLVPRSCGHPCLHPCHDGPCPESKCKIMTDVNCPCGRKTDSLICWKRENEYDRCVTWEMNCHVKKLEDEAKAKKGDSINITENQKAEFMQSFKEKIPKSSVLECDKECAKMERNKKLAEALQLENADLTTTSIGTPNYSEFLTKFAKKNPQFIETIHKQLTDLVIKSKQSVKKNVTYAFNSMNRDKRHVIHEYSDHFGVLSESFDEEPNRNVVCFASKEKSYLPSVSLIDAVFRPPPVRSERLKPHDDVTFRPEKRAQVVGPSSWNTKTTQKILSSSSQSEMVALNIPGASSGSSDFPPL